MRLSADIVESGRSFDMGTLLRSLGFVLIVLMLSFGISWGASVTLSWDAPTTNEDGSPLTDLDGYKLYFYTVSGGWSNPQGLVDMGNVLTYTGNHSDNTYFVVTAYDVTGNESGPSNEVFFGISPAAPANLRLGN